MLCFWPAKRATVATLTLSACSSADTHAYGSLGARVVIGSVSNYVLNHAQCPVLVVKQPHDEQAKK